MAASTWGAGSGGGSERCLGEWHRTRAHHIMALAPRLRHVGDHGPLPLDVDVACGEEALQWGAEVRKGRVGHLHVAGLAEALHAAGHVEGVAWGGRTTVD